MPIPESHRLIAAHKAPLKGLKSKNSPLTYTATCIHTSMPSQHNPPTHLPTRSHKHTLFSSPKTIMSTSLKNICSNCFGSKTISCVFRPPRAPQIPTQHKSTEGCLCTVGCYFYPHCGGQIQGEVGEHSHWRLFSYKNDCQHVRMVKVTDT